MDTNGPKGPTSVLVPNEINLLGNSASDASLLPKKAPAGSRPLIGGRRPEKQKSSNTFAPIEPLRPAVAYGLAGSTQVQGRNDVNNYRNHKTNIFSKKDSSSKNIEEEELEDENSIK